MPPVELFKALGDPTRLEMITRLSSGGSYTITTLSSGLKLSRQGARKHLQILADSKIIMMRTRGRNTIVELDRQTLDIGKNFIAKLTLGWEKRLEALKIFVDKK
ncbi:MAG: transcriptional regulator, ArsR family [Candidatus Taylorbacteria bacterium]|nr:transcriptional regulator, ArsR family [Candidatus Taylorbacteria bacterium]